MVYTGIFLLYPLKYLRTTAYFRNLISVRYEMYAVRDGAYYSHFKSGGRNSRAHSMKGNFWVWTIMYN